MAIKVLKLKEALAVYDPEITPENLNLEQNKQVRKRYEAYQAYIKTLGFLEQPISEKQFYSERPLGAVQKFVIDDEGILKRPINIETYIPFPVSENPDVSSVSIYSNEDYISDGWIIVLRDFLITNGFEVKGAEFAKTINSIDGLTAEVDRLIKFKVVLQDVILEEEAGRPGRFMEKYNSIEVPASAQDK